MSRSIANRSDSSYAPAATSGSIRVSDAGCGTRSGPQPRILAARSPARLTVTVRPRSSM